MKFTEILSAARRDGNSLSFPGPDAWKQGRTLYGGLTASLCLHTALELTEVSSQLRSALISFVGPSSTDLTGTAEMLRAGRTASSVHAALRSGGAAATQALLTFSDSRDSAVAHAPLTMPAVKPPNPSDVLDFASQGGPVFLNNFDIIMAGGAAPMTGSAEPEVCWWARHRDPEARGSYVGLLCLGDILPPAALSMVTEPTPVSSMTWMMDIIGSDISTDDGWYLFASKADAVSGGFSTQDMSIWNTAGKLIGKGRQTVTMFG